jgi:hypothetical protein
MIFSRFCLVESRLHLSKYKSKKAIFLKEEGKIHLISIGVLTNAGILWL